MPLWLNEADIRACLTMPAVMTAMEAALAAFSGGRVDQPVRTSFDLRERSFVALMPAYDSELGLLATKLVSVIPENAGRGLPTHLASISLVDGVTGELLAVMDGRLITEMRTAAVSALSVKLLARRDAAVLAILGSGVQARSHVQALPGFEDVRAWSPNAHHLAEFSEETGVRAAESAEAAVRDADVVVLATNSVTPVLADEWVKYGAHVISLGAARVTQREIAPELLERARLVVDSREAALAESGDIVQAIREGRIRPEDASLELGEVVVGRLGRRSEEDVTLFKSLGLAVEDLATAALAYRAARAAGLGVELQG
ncbi:MAG TPA: ornithine cyclodeaminase family protein [Candidatus Sulfopaludibacter sp.]|jgi:ornithine cyclodeaminase|nr:ornithine cyclodeaminase family protein [Candidatus Sulfopaludibacter sp.]